jgi:hypothetical protein
MPTLDLWLFTVTDLRTGKRRRTTYRLTLEEARATRSRFRVRLSGGK